VTKKKTSRKKKTTKKNAPTFDNVRRVQLGGYLIGFAALLVGISNFISYRIIAYIFRVAAFGLLILSLYLFIGSAKFWPFCKNKLKSTIVPCMRCLPFLVGIFSSSVVFNIFRKQLLPIITYFNSLPWLYLVGGFIMIMPTLYQGSKRRSGKPHYFRSSIYLVIFGFMASIGVFFIFAFCYIEFGMR
jgi:hypothetical protein